MRRRRFDSIIHHRGRTCDRRVGRVADGRDCRLNLGRRRSGLRRFGTVQHRQDHRVGNAMLPQVNDLARIQTIAVLGISDEGHHDVVADFCLREPHDL